MWAAANAAAAPWLQVKTIFKTVFFFQDHNIIPKRVYTGVYVYIYSLRRGSTATH